MHLFSQVSVVHLLKTVRLLRIVRLLQKMVSFCIRLISLPQASANMPALFDLSISSLFILLLLLILISISSSISVIPAVLMSAQHFVCGRERSCPPSLLLSALHVWYITRTTPCCGVIGEEHRAVQKLLFWIDSVHLAIQYLFIYWSLICDLY